MKKDEDKLLELRAKGNKLFSEEKYEEALIAFSEESYTLLQQYIKLNKGSACYFQLSEFKKALEDGITSMKLDKTFYKAYYRVANAYMELNDIEKALEILKNFPFHNDYLISFKNELEERKSEKDFNMKTYKSYSFFNQFFNWINEGKLSYKKLELKYFSDDHRGIFAKSYIKKGDIIMKIPKDLLITLEIARETKIGSKISELNLLSPKHCLLSSYILLEKNNPNSKWTPYLDILPKSYDNFPIFFNDEELSFLNGSPFLLVISNKKRDILADYNKIITSIPEFQQFSFNEFSQVRMAVSSRIFGITVDQKKTDCFAPLADMLNHKRPRHTEWYYSDSQNSFIIQALDNIEKGQEVFDSYGKKCNSRFLLNYGFIVEKNDGNEFPFHLELDSNDPMFNLKKHILRGQSKKTFLLNEFTNDTNVLDFLSFLRFKHYDEGEFDELLENSKYYYEESKFFPIPPISIKNELSVLEQIEQLTYDALNKYDTSLKDDLELISGQNNLTNNQRNCVLMRIGEKQILHYFLDLSRFACELMYMDLIQIRKHCEEAFPIFNPFENYINESILMLKKSEIVINDK